VARVPEDAVPTDGRDRNAPMTRLRSLFAVVATAACFTLPVAIFESVRSCD
jgi:hypothetical protein